MIPSDTNTITHGLCRDCGKGGFLADGLCRDCIQKRAVDEHFAPDNDLRNPQIPPVVRIRKGWGV